MTADGARLWADEDYNDHWMAGPNFTELAVADVDGDSRIETIATGADTLVHCISDEGEKRWTRSIGDDPAGMVITPAGIAAASRTGDLHMIGGDGERIWRTELGSPCTALALAGEWLCVGLEDGRLVRVDLTGTPLQVTALPAAPTDLVACGERIYAATADGAICPLGDV